jgi:hypothetical protein
VQLIDEPVRSWEKQLDVGLADADALILRVFTHVQVRAPRAGARAVQRRKCCESLGERSRGRFATPADFPLHDCSPYRGLYVRRERLGFVYRSRTIFCRRVPNLTLRFAAIASLYSILRNPTLPPNPPDPLALTPDPALRLRVQAWLAQWQDALGVDHVERDGAAIVASSGILPRERCGSQRQGDPSLPVRLCPWSLTSDWGMGPARYP